jgi:hypothetical protein
MPIPGCAPRRDGAKDITNDNNNAATRARLMEKNTSPPDDGQETGSPMLARREAWLARERTPSRAAWIIPWATVGE